MLTTLAPTLPMESLRGGSLEFAVVCGFSLLGLTFTAAVLPFLSDEAVNTITASMSLG
jgi:hypothetical protein